MSLNGQRGENGDDGDAEEGEKEEEEEEELPFATPKCVDLLVRRLHGDSLDRALQRAHMLLQLGRECFPEDSFLRLLSAFYQWSFDIDRSKAGENIHQMVMDPAGLALDLRYVLYCFTVENSSISLRTTELKTRLQATIEAFSRCHMTLHSLWKTVVTEDSTSAYLLPPLLMY